MNVSLPIGGSPDSALGGPDPSPTFTAAPIAGHSSAPPAVPPAALFTPAAPIPAPAGSPTTGQVNSNPPDDWCVDVFRGNHPSPGVLPNAQHKFAMLKGNPFRVALRAEIPVLQDKTRVTINHPTFWNAFNHVIPATANGAPEYVVWSDFIARIHNAITQIPYGRWSTLVALAEAAGAPHLSSRPDEVTLTVMLQAPAGVPIHRILLFNYEVLLYERITRAAITPQLPAAGVPPVLGGPQHAVPGVAQNNIPHPVGGSLSAGSSVLPGGAAVSQHNTLISPAMQGHDTDRSDGSGGSSLQRHRTPAGHSQAPAPGSSAHQDAQHGDHHDVRVLDGSRGGLSA
jgi:alkylated DNA nucleotide flippase Atl1